MVENKANQTTEKELISKINKQLMQFNMRKNKLNQKVGRRSKQTLPQRRHIDDQETHEKMLNITHY